LADFVEGKMPAEYTELVDAHLASCDACRQFAAMYRKVLEYARRLPPLPLPPELLQRFLRAVQDMYSRLGRNE
jgi:anti-sigma factor RsiW